MSFLKKIISILIVFVCFITIVIALVPAVINTEWGRKQILSIANNRIPGKISLTDIHLSWFGTQEIKGLVLKDPNGHVVTSIDRIAMDSPLWKLLTRKLDLSGLEIQELNGKILLNASGYTTIQEALIANLPPKTLPLVPSEVPLDITHVNAKFGQLSSQKPFSIHFQGQTQQGDLKGLIEADILLSETENSHIKATISGFPVDILDDLVSLNKPELYGIFHELLGDRLNLVLDDTLSHKGQQFDLTFSAANMEGAFKGMITDREIRLMQPGLIKMKATPDLFDQIIAFAEPTSPILLKKPTDLVVQVEDLAWPLPGLLNDGVENNQASFVAKAQFSPTHFALAERDLLSFNSLDIRLAIAQNGQLDIRTSGSYKGDAFGGEISLSVPNPLSPLHDFNGKARISSLPVESIPLLGEADLLTADFSAGLRGPDSLHIDRLALGLQGKDMSSFQIEIDPVRLNLHDISLATLNLRGIVKVESESSQLNMQGKVAIENGALHVQANHPLDIIWTLTPKNWSYLRKLALKTSADQERLRLNENTPVTLQIQSLYVPFKQSNAIIDNGVKATLTVKQLNLADKKTNEVFSIHDLQAQIQTPEQSDTLTFSLTANPRIQSTQEQQARITVNGEMKNLFDGNGAFDTSRLSCKMKVDSKKIPVELVAALCALDEATQARLKALIGSRMNADADINIQQMTGLVKADVQGDLGQAQLDGQIKKGFLTLNKPLVFQVAVTPQLGQTILNDFVPILSSAVSSSEPIKIHIDPRGFSLPLSPFTIGQTQIPYMTLSLGKINFLNQGELRAILNLLKASKREQLSIWFTPLYVGLQDGVIHCHRTDMLIADAYPIAVWGKIDLNKDKVKMTVGLGEPALRHAFGIRGLDKHYLMQMPLTGTTGNVRIDQARAAAYIAALVAQMQQVPAGDILGTVLQIAGSGFSDPTPPEPTTKPLPWEGQFNDDVSEKESKNPAKAIPKATNEVMKEVEKGASKLLKLLR